MIARGRELIRSLYDRLIFLPTLFVVGGFALSLIAIRVDRRIPDENLPRALRTTVTSADSILSTIAGGLITAITLLLSLVLLSVQLASSQFSPRTLRDWIGDRTQQITIGLVLGTTVYCLMVLRETQTIDDTTSVAPDLSVLLAVGLAVLCLVAVVRSVGHLSNSMRIDSVARTLATETVAALRAQDELDPDEAPTAIALSRVRPDANDLAGWVPVVARRSGWVRRIDRRRLVELAPEGATVRVTTAIGAFVVSGEPIAWIDHLDEHADSGDELRCPDEAVSIGETRLLGTDAGYGILQMSDIAMRALSPGVNDPNTACDVVVHLGLVVLAVWERPAPPASTTIDGRTVVSDQLDHVEYLDAAFSQIRRYGASDVSVCTTLLRTLGTLEREVVRRGLPGPVQPIRDEARRVVASMEASSMLGVDREQVRSVAREIGVLDEPTAQLRSAASSERRTFPASSRTGSLTSS